MNFHIVHTTRYEYSEPAVESHSELRVHPRNTSRQVVRQHTTAVDPRVPLESFTDYYGNHVEMISVPWRHTHLTVTSRSAVETRERPARLEPTRLTKSEAVRLCWPRRRELYDFLMPSRHAPCLPQIEELGNELMPSTKPFHKLVHDLNHWIYTNLKYVPGVTDIQTPIGDVLEKRAGVCQDFAHLMIALFRSVGLPARYVSGYIETDDAAQHSERLRAAGQDSDLEDDSADDRRLVGATASHAWVEVYSPSGDWIGLDPTNNMLESERHVQIGIGRDYGDVPPLRGVFKGAQRQLLSVKVSVRRTGRDHKPTSATAPDREQELAELAEA